MKRFLVILLAALLLFSFTSCNQDKIDELEAKVKQEEAKVEQEKADHEATIKNFEDFFEAMSAIGRYTQLYSSTLGASADSVDVTLDKTKVSSFTNYLSSFVSLEEGESVASGDASIEAASGTIKGKNKHPDGSGTYIPYDIDLTYTNVSTTIKYSVSDKNGKIAAKTDLTITISVSGRFIQKEDANTGATTVSFKGTINGTEYDYSFAKNKYGEFTSAKINGNNVELRLINAANLMSM